MAVDMLPGVACWQQHILMTSIESTEVETTSASVLL